MIRSLVGLLVCLGWLAHAQPAAPVVRVPLKPIAVAAGQFQPGLGVASLPSRAWSAAVGRQTFLLFDLNGDGALQAGPDGLALAEIPFVARLPEVVLSRAGQHRWHVRDGVLELTPAGGGISEALLRDAAELTAMRLMAGLPPVAVDAEASRHCAAHIAYLAANGMSGGRSGMSVHSEQEGRPGYTEEGEIAARNCDLHFRQSSLREALWGWYCTTWHGVPIVKPSLSHVGVGFESGVAMLYFSGHEHPSSEGDFLHPVAGARGVQRAYHCEIPNPVPGTREGRGCGFPVTIQLNGEASGRRLVSATLVDARSNQAVKGTFSCPENPANRTEWPSNSNVAVFIPSRPLSGNTTYLATFTFEGLPAPITWRFTTE